MRSTTPTVVSSCLAVWHRSPAGQRWFEESAAKSRVQVPRPGPGPGSYQQSSAPVFECIPEAEAFLARWTRGSRIGESEVEVKEE